MTRGACFLLVGLVLAVGVTPAPGVAQLLSPGRLAVAHADLEGIRNCTECHQLGKAGVSAERCVACHTEIGTRVARGSGYHATVEADACASCHQEHLGTDFHLVRFDTTSFDHTEVGFGLDLSHAAVACRDCHAQNKVRDPLVLARKTDAGALARTYLGLPTECAGCHRDESPHGDQFGAQACAECHDAGDWESASAFDHARTDFPLDGLHAGVDCADCHGTGATARYEGLPAAACSDCHADPHDGAMEGTCSGCHDTGGWHALR
ncbi:MAG: hypothetical protein ABL963_05450, partial [Longimicrobiales bacterium]